MTETFKQYLYIVAFAIAWFSVFIPFFGYIKNADSVRDRNRSTWKQYDEATEALANGIKEFRSQQ